MTNKNDVKKMITVFSLFAILMLSVAPLGTALADKDDKKDEKDDNNKGNKVQFKALDESASCLDPSLASTFSPWDLPKGWKQKIIGVEDFAGTAIEDLTDMNQQNAVGIPMPDKLISAGVADAWAEKGRLLYTTHEVGNAIGVPNLGTASSISVTDLQTGISVKLTEQDHWDRFDGLLWTSQNTLLAAEECLECAVGDPDVADDRSGLVYEIDPVTGTSEVRPALGSMAHEGIGEDKDGNIYGIDEFAFGSIYKFVPDTKGDLSEGTLYVLKLKSGDNDPFSARNGQAEWLEISDAQAKKDAREEALALGATQYNRPEDVEIIDDVLYVSLTDDTREVTASNVGRYDPNGIVFASIGDNTPDDRKVIGIDIRDSDNPVVFDFVVPGVNVVKEDTGISGFAKPDNLTQQGGELWVVEDNTPSDIWKTKAGKRGELAKKVELFASNEDCRSEGTGLLWGIGDYKDILFVNVQHADPNDDSGNRSGPDLKMVIYKQGQKTNFFEDNN